jgi:hypothetical protein
MPAAAHSLPGQVYGVGAPPPAARPTMDHPPVGADMGPVRPGRRPVVLSAPPRQGMPKWAIPLLLVIALAVVAFVLLTR